MLIKQLQKVGFGSDVMNGLGLASIAASIAVWFRARQDESGHGRQSAIFIGLWAPTFFVLGSSMVTTEQDPLLLQAASK